MPDDQPADDGCGRACNTFFMLNANFVRKFPGKSLPFFQEIRDDYTTDEPLVEVALDYADVVKGTHIETTLAVSHRWMQPDDPDPDGEQLKALKDFLNSPAGQKIERVWIDSACMPQDLPKGSRSAEDAATFKRMLKEVNRLYLGTTVLILLDLSYVSRFWTQFESWLAMQFAMPDGLKPAVGTKNERHHIVCIQNAGESLKSALVDLWAAKTPDEAHDILSKPDVTVTNLSDKEGQLPKIKALDSTVKDALGSIAQLLEDELVATEDAAARAEAELSAWETENDAKAGVGNRLKVAATQAAIAAAAAKDAKQVHAQAISLGIAPATMKREQFLAEDDVPATVEHVRNGGDREKQQAALALAKHAWNVDNNVQIAQAGGIAPLVVLARDGTEGQSVAAATALMRLAINHDNRVAIAKAGGIATLVLLARDGTEEQKESAGLVLRLLTINDDNAVEAAKATYGTGFGELGFESIVKKVSIEPDGCRFCAACDCLVFCSPSLDKMLVPRVRLRLLKASMSHVYVGAAPADPKHHVSKAVLGYSTGLGFAIDGTVRLDGGKLKGADAARAFKKEALLELRYDAPTRSVQLWARDDKDAFVLINERAHIPAEWRFAVGCCSSFYDSSCAFELHA